MIRTDLAVEKIPVGAAKLDGIEKKVRSGKSCEITEITITSDKAGEPIGKPRGRYITVETHDLSKYPDSFEDVVECVAEEIRKLSGDGSILVIGLGNKEITPDALGPQAVSRVVATRHIADELPDSHELSGLRSVSAIATGVLGQTGIEASEVVRAICERTKPSAVIAIDALACSDTERLGCTVQICDAGISPGSGVENARKELSQRTIGVPVIAVGVPTVVDMHTIVESLTGQEVSSDRPNMMVTTRDVDRLIGRAAKLIGYAVDRAFLPSFSFEDLEIMCG